VWWLSRRLRIERELCADELAVMATGKRLEYAQALEQIAGERQADIRPALAAFLRGETDMRLLQRVRNVLSQPTSERSRLWPAGIIALVLPIGLWAAAAISGVAIADDDGDEPKKPTVKRERGDRDVETRVIIRKDKEGGGERSGGKGDEVEERIVRYRIEKEGQPPRDEYVQERVIKRDGKRIIEEKLGVEGKRGDQGDRRLDELTMLVKRLSAQVEKLQAEVTQLRSGNAGDKASTRVREQSNELRREAEERSSLDARKRELQRAVEKIEATKNDLEARARAEEVKAREKAELAGQKAAEKAEAESRASRQDLEKIKRAIGERKEELEKDISRKVREELNRSDEPQDRRQKVLKEYQRAKELKEEAARDKDSGELKELEKKLKSLKEQKERTGRYVPEEQEFEAKLKKELIERQSLIK
jgi:hypothetical protein